MVQVVRSLEREYRTLGVRCVEHPRRYYECREGRYSWFDDCLERLEGKEARQEYYGRLVH